MRLKTSPLPRVLTATTLTLATGLVSLMSVMNSGSAHAATPIRHVVVIPEENHSFSQVIGTSAAPYINSLASRYGLATNYQAGDPTADNSLPSYFMMTEGSTGGVTNDCSPAACPQSGDNIFHQTAAAGQQWRVYAESEPTNCDHAAVSGLYAARHAPAPYFTDESGNCMNWDVPLGTTTSGALASDLAAGSLPAYAMVTPNLDNDMHSGTVQQGDAWLATWIPRMMASPNYLHGDTAIFITWDEGSGADNHVATIVIAPGVFGVKDTTAYTHYSLLRTTEELLGLPLLGGAASPSTASMAAAFGLAPGGGSSGGGGGGGGGGGSGSTPVTSANPAAVKIGSGRSMNVLFRGSRGNLAVLPYQPSSGWGSATDLGGVQLYGPTATSPVAGQVDAMVTGQDRQLWMRSWNGASWGGWSALGGVLTASPAAVSPQPGDVDVFARGADGALWYRAQAAGHWSSWQSLGGMLSSAPVAVTNGAGTVTVFVVGSDHAVWARSATATAWGSWTQIGGVATSAPAADVESNGVLDLFVRGQDSALWHRTLQHGSISDGLWSSWESLGGRLSASPSATQWGSAGATVIVPGTDSRLYQKTWQKGAWSAWSVVG